MRLDRLLVYLRFARSRAKAAALIEAGHMRVSGRGAARASDMIAAGDVLTFALGPKVRIIEVLAIPPRRGPASEAHSCYRELDRSAKTAIAAGKPASFRKDCAS